MQQAMQESHGKRGTHQATHEVVGWTNIDQPGFYVSKSTGQGFRITNELLIPGASPALGLLGADKERFVQVSEDPYIPVTPARLVCADNDVSPNF